VKSVFILERILFLSTLTTKFVVYLTIAASLAASETVQISVGSELVFRFAVSTQVSHLPLHVCCSHSRELRSASEHSVYQCQPCVTATEELVVL